MAFEAGTFNALGLNIDPEDVYKIRDAYAQTYETLSNKDEKWRNIAFRKSQLDGLWESISAFLDISWEKNQQEKKVNSEFLRKNLIINKENEDFLFILAKTDAPHILIKKLESVTIETSSLRFVFGDRRAGGQQSVSIDMAKFSPWMRKYADRVRNSLRHFVDWASTNRKPIVTCFMVSGIVAVALISGLWVGAATIAFAKLVIPLAISIICAIAGVASASGDSVRFVENLSRYRGVTLS